MLFLIGKLLLFFEFVIMVRLRYKYIIGQLLPPLGTPSDFSAITARDIQTTLKAFVEEIYGDEGLGVFSSSSSVRFLDIEHTCFFVIKTPASFYRKLLFALCSISKVKSCSCSIRTLRVQCTARGAKAALERLVRLHCSCQSGDSQLSLQLKMVQKSDI
ncbi:hypothetical protein EON64_10990 [archaeon]|nr:MAG: hypothetical protein EON64_10990 [archaeon]